MRRHDREVTDSDTIDSIIKNACCVRLGFNDNGEVYIVPLSFGFENVDGKRVFYFHSARQGRKIDLIYENPNVGFELDAGYELKTADIPCAYSVKFESVIGNGVISFVEDDTEKKKALNLILKNTADKDGFDFTSAMLDRVMVFKLEAVKISCKVHE